MKRKKTLLLLSPRKQSVDVLIRHIWRGFSTLSHLLMRYRQQSVDTPHLARVLNTSTLVFQGNTKKILFHAHNALMEAL